MEVFRNHPHWDYIDSIADYGIYRIRKDGKWGFLDVNQNLIIPCRWEYIDLFFGDFIYPSDAAWLYK